MRPDRPARKGHGRGCPRDAGLTRRIRPAEPSKEDTTVTGQFLAERRMALEEAFFRAKEQKQLQSLRDELDRKRTREELAAASGIGDQATLDHMIDLGVNGQTLAAVSLVPLLWVAWADRKMDAREREAVLRAAQQKGIAPGSPTHALLTTWLEHRPDRELFEAWAHYARALTSSLVPARREPFKQQIVE